MKKLLVVLIAILAVVTVFSCSKKEAAEVSPEMKDFMTNFGSSSSIAQALLKHGIANLDKKDMDLYDLKEPEVVKTDKKGDETCYSIEAKAGITTRSYSLCWKEGKIQSVADLGMK